MENKNYKKTFYEIGKDIEFFLKEIRTKILMIYKTYKKKLNYENSFIIYERQPKQFNILNNSEDGNEAQIIVEKKKYNNNDNDKNFKIIESINNMTFNIAYIKQNIFYGYYEDTFYKCYNVQCRQYEEIKNDKKFCIEKDKINFDIVNIKNYKEVESFGNCINAFKKYKFNNEFFRWPY